MSENHICGQKSPGSPSESSGVGSLLKSFGASSEGYWLICDASWEVQSRELNKQKKSLVEVFHFHFDGLYNFLLGTWKGKPLQVTLVYQCKAGSS